MSDAAGPLSAALVRQLTDKLYEKRKSAALDIEKLVRELIVSNQSAQLDRVLLALRELSAQAGQPNARKGGLIGLAAAAIALGKNAAPYTRQLILPVLTCFQDPDLNVRYYACESLYNIIKMLRTAALVHFDELFDSLYRLAGDADQNVRSGAELLDRLLMDIVLSKDDFDVARLMTQIRDKIYVETSANRRFVVQWLNTLLGAPHFSVLPWACEVADGLFKMLSDQQQGVRDTTAAVLTHFLSAVERQPDALTSGDQSDFGTIVNVLVVHAHEQEPPLARRIALLWLDRLLATYGATMLPYLALYLSAVLPALEDVASSAKGSRDSTASTSAVTATTRPALAAHVNQQLRELVTAADSTLQLADAVKELLAHIRHPRDETRTAALHWIRHLHGTQPKQMFAHIDGVFPVLLALLADHSDHVLLLSLQLLSDVCRQHAEAVPLDSLKLPPSIVQKLSGVSPYLVKFVQSLLDMFAADGKLLPERGILIIRQLCLLLDARAVLGVAARLLGRPDWPRADFSAQVVAVLHGVMMTAPELYVLREQLQTLSDETTCQFWLALYESWCEWPVAAVGLCLLSRQYAHAAELAIRLARLPVSVDVLHEVDRLVALIESPVLAGVRLDLLSAKHQKPLATVLSALLMLLPQTDAFTTLHRRLQAVPALATVQDPSDAISHPPSFDFPALLAHFERAVERQRQALRTRHLELLERQT